MANWIYLDLSAKDVRTFEQISDEDMLTAVIVYRLSVCLSLWLTASALYVPQIRTSEEMKRSRAFHMSLNTETRRSASSENDHESKRHSMFDFSKVMTRHASRHTNERKFVDDMFYLFDINGDNRIERKEFKAMLQLFGIVSHAF